jgi:hypothetical protein
MSSLQKFHRRTNMPAAVADGFTTIGSGSDTIGYWLGDLATNRLVVAPKSTEAQKAWGSQGTVRNTISTTNGLANTNTLVSFGTSAHPAAGHCKYLSTGGYNTWYLPAKDELNTCYSNKSAVPFATANSFVGGYYWSSTEYNGDTAWFQNMSSGFQYYYGKNYGGSYVRAVRRSTI